jgi:hypothetical protein
MLTGTTSAAPQTKPGSKPGPEPRPEPGIRPGTDDGTRPLLLAGFWTLVVGLAAAAAIRLLFGGVGIHGPHTNGGWLSLMLALMCLPFGTMLLLLGGAKYLRNRRMARR